MAAPPKQYYRPRLLAGKRPRGEPDRGSFDCNDFILGIAFSSSSSVRTALGIYDCSHMAVVQISSPEKRSNESTLDTS